LSPTILRSGPYRLFFFSGDRDKPRHVHVSRDRKVAKFWLSPVHMEHNYGFGVNELRRIGALVRRHEADLIEAWDDYFKSGHTDTSGQDVGDH